MSEVMEIAERLSGVVTFTGYSSAVVKIPNVGRGGQLADQTSMDYFRWREQIERAAAKNAQSGVARRIHQELAQEYADLIRGTALIARSEVRR